jgi:outer membrane lipoprotein carrier protein
MKPMRTLHTAAMMLSTLAATVILSFAPGSRADGDPPTIVADGPPTTVARGAPTIVARGPLTNVADVVARVQAFYNQTKTFNARFQQDYIVKAYNTTKHSSGRVVFEKPGKMGWTYDQPNGNRVVSDGNVLKIYEKENQQMYEQPLNKSQYPAALAFLMGQGELDKSFTLRLLDARKMKYEGGFVLEGTPKSATPAYQKVIMFVDGPTAQVRRMLILDAQGNRNTFTFESPVVNVPVPPEEFTFTPPSGTQIVRP